MKKIPLRKCAGCNEMKEKPDLLRVVRGAEGQVAPDSTGRSPGRGAYLCKKTECLEKAQKNTGLERSFHAPIPKDVYERLKELLQENS
jgi:predicted RNA-binding protein YlxR (DUF448 family)